MSFPQHPSIVSALENLALTDPNKPAFIFVRENLDRLVLTRREVWDYSRKYAAMLRKVGLNKGDVVCNTLPNSPLRLISMFGAITAGCITMSAQTVMADGSDLVSSLNKGKATAIIADISNQKRPFSALMSRLDKYHPLTNDISCSDVPSLKFIISHTIMGNSHKFLESLNDGEELYENIEPKDICVYMSTSGSEGDVKLVPFSSNLLIEIGEVAYATFRDKIFMCDLDMGWVCGFPHAYLANGTTRVLLDKGSSIPEHSAALQWTVIVQEKCNFCFTAPLYLLEFSEVRRNNDHDEIKKYKLETIIAAGGSVTREHVQASVGDIAEEVKIFYGSTEGGFCSTKVIRSVDEYEDFNTGWPTQNTKFKIVDNHNKVNFTHCISTL